jgi:hypothetical protein
VAIVAMADAVSGTAASSDEYNKVVDNIVDIDSRLGAVVSTSTAHARLNTLESRTTDASTGNTALGSRVSTLETRTTDASTGNTALGTRVTTLETRTTDGTTGNAALGTRVSALEAGGGTGIVGVVAYHIRTTASSASTGAAVAVARISSISLVSGRMYRFYTSPLHVTGPAGSGVEVQLRATFNNTNASATSTVKGSSQGQVASSSIWECLGTSFLYVPGANQTASVCLCIALTSGSGNASIGGDPTYPIELIVECLGTAPSDTGTNL